MNRLCITFSALLLLIGLTAPLRVFADDLFERQVRPLLVEKCGDCHGVEEPEAELTLTTVAGLARGGSLGPLLEPGKPDQSRLIQAVRYTGKLKMPPEEKLSAEQIGLLEAWVRGGAPLPGATIAIRGHEEGFVISEADRNWWAFQPIKRPTVPMLADSSRVRMPLDHFVIRRLEDSGLTLAPEASRVAWIRRATFDLLGVPPTPAQIEAFVNDASPDAFERLVDRLLASPLYGERWGRHWLDVARYADTNGGGFDYVYPNAWKYRDYVVQSWNQDKPFDRFLVEQLAGDLMPVDCDQETYVERLTATGFLAIAPKGLGMQDKEQMVLDVVDDQIDVLGRSVLGLTLACARCHDHKFDPIATRDYYSLAGIFRSTVTVSQTDKNPSYWPEKSLELPSTGEARKEYQKRKAENEKALSEATRQADVAVAAAVQSRLAEYLFAAERIRRSNPSAKATAHWNFDEQQGADVLAAIGPKGRLGNKGGADGPSPQRVAGRIGRAVRFVGRGDVVSIDPSSSIEFGSNTDFSVSLWMRAGEGYSPKTADSVISAEYPSALWFIALRPGPYHGVYLRHYDGKRTVDIKPIKDQTSTLTDGAWHHLVFTSDRDGTGRVFLDGKQVGEASIGSISSAADYSKPKAFHLGSVTNQFAGDLDDIALWDRLLSSTEIATIYAQGSQLESPLNLSEVEAKRVSLNPTSPMFTLEQAKQQGLVPSVIRKLLTELEQAAADSGAPLHAFASAPDLNRARFEMFVAEHENALQAWRKAAKQDPFLPNQDGASHYDTDSRKRIAALRAESQEIEQTRVPDAPVGMTVYDHSKPRDLRVHVAGDHRDLGIEAPRGFPQVLSEAADLPRYLRESDDATSGRLALAKWVTHPSNPLTSRVLVNRVWQHHFGEGLVRTSDNFGALGERPSHPELLDWLACELVEGGWSVKALHRQIMLSATYRQASSRGDAPSIDSDNRLLWRMNRRRLEGEALRDAMMAVSGRLELRLGGTVNQWKAKMFSVDDANKETANYKTNRRSIYLPVVRGAALHDMLQLFDFGDPNSVVSRRGVTTVAPQALFMLNSEFVTDQSEAFASRIRSLEASELEERVEYAYMLALGRIPTGNERQRAAAFLSDATQPRWRLFCQMLFCLNEFAYVE